MVYRGEGTIAGDEEDGTRIEERIVIAPADPASVGMSAVRSTDREASWPRGAIARGVEISIGHLRRGWRGEALDIGALRGTVDAGDQRTRGRLWLKSEQADRYVDLRRD